MSANDETFSVSLRPLGSNNVQCALFEMSGDDNRR